jgi:hypothetical protein
LALCVVTPIRILVDGIDCRRKENGANNRNDYSSDY